MILPDTSASTPKSIVVSTTGRIKQLASTDHMESVLNVAMVTGSVVTVQLNVVSNVSFTNPTSLLNIFFAILAREGCRYINPSVAITES